MSPYRRLAEGFVRDRLEHYRGWALDIGGAGERGRYIGRFDWEAIDVKAGATITAQADMRYLPFDAGLFDVVKATDCLYFLAHPKPALDEAFRVLRRGGMFVATVPWLAGKIEPGDLGRWSAECWRAILIAAGFTEGLVRPLGGPLVTVFNALAGWYGWRWPGLLTPLLTRLDRSRMEWWACGYGLCAVKP